MVKFTFRDETVPSGLYNNSNSTMFFFVGAFCKRSRHPLVLDEILAFDYCSVMHLKLINMYCDCFLKKCCRSYSFISILHGTFQFLEYLSFNWSTFARAPQSL
mmetsp:Transcript_42475/g.89179  ORF Transcript_42475/g.89179 Transcript_42475/m.89179 type:complete len:103 (+) Transcript_42475:134-442(+)